MKNRKKIIVIINKFPKILHMITKALAQENVDYILDASNYTQPVSLLGITYPDKLLLNLKLPNDQAIELMGREMQESMEIRQGMITSNPRAYYMSICSTLGSEYIIDRHLDLELIPGVISKQQLN